VAVVVAAVAVAAAVAAVAVAAVAVGSPAAASRGSAILTIKGATARSIYYTEYYSVAFLYLYTAYTVNSRADNSDFEQIELDLKKGRF
jgi:hypothetical protein